MSPDREWCADTSLVVAALSEWHAHHEVSRHLVELRRPMLPAHVYLESYATLTRIPGHEVEPEIVLEALRLSFPRRNPGLPSAGHCALVARLATAGIVGGRVYDGLVGATAKAAGTTLITRDRRATVVYDLVGCSYDLIAHAGS